MGAVGGVPGSYPRVRPGASVMSVTQVDGPCEPCVAQLIPAGARVTALQAALMEEPEPLVALTHLLHLCRDEHRALRESTSSPTSRSRVASTLVALADVLPPPGTARVLDPTVRRGLAAALEPAAGVPPVAVARALAELLDSRYGHTFTDSFRRRSPYQPAVGDPIPLDTPDLRLVTGMRATSPPWRLAHRLDQTQRIGLAGETTVQFRVVYDYSAADALAGLVTHGTVIATVHPNRSLAELDLARDTGHGRFPIAPADPVRQRTDIDHLIGLATAADASIVMLPELCVTEEMALGMEDWVRRPAGPRLLIAGSFHHEDQHGDEACRRRRRNTTIAWLRGHDRPLTHDKHSAGDRPVVEDIQPQGWPEIRVYVAADGWHLAIAICRDLLNPQAVQALAEAGANLVLVPAMSETLMAFGGPAAQRVGARQAILAVANNPGDWTINDDTTAVHPARALFGHPGLGQQTRLVQSPDSGPGVALLHVDTAQIEWLPARPSAESSADMHSHDAPSGATQPIWVRALLEESRMASPPAYRPGHVSMRNAAVLVLLTDGVDGPHVLLTERAADLGDYPSQLVFPGGVAEVGDDGPAGTALREAAEEVGLDPDTVHLISLLPPMALPDSGFLVHPVLAWSQAPVFNRSMNYAEVASVIDTPLRQLAGRGRPPQPPARGDAGPAVDLRRLGRTTGAVADLLLAMLHRAGVDLEVEMARATVTRVGSDPTIGLLGVRRGHG